MLFPGLIHGCFLSLADFFFFFDYLYYSKSLKRISYIIIIIFFQSFNLNVYFYFLFSLILYYLIYKFIKNNQKCLGYVRNPIREWRRYVVTT